MAENIFSGPKCIIKKDGAVVGFGTDIQVSVSQDLARINVLGDVHSKQIEVVGISVTVSMGMVRIWREAPANDGSLAGSPENMGMMGRGTTSDIVFAPSYNIEAFNSLEGQNLFVVEGCKLDSHGVSIDARGIAGQNVSFQGIRMSDEND